MNHPHESLRLVSTALLAVAITQGLNVKGAEYPGSSWHSTTPAEAGMNSADLARARDHALTGGGSGCIIRGGVKVFEWGDQTALYDLKSTSKSIGVTLLGLALKDELVKLDDLASNHHPLFGVPPGTNRISGWLEAITLRQLANHTAGFEKPGDYGKLLFRPGTEWFYSDAGPNWLAECLTHEFRRDLNDVLFERVFGPIGITPDAMRWRKHAYRPELMNHIQRREFGSGFTGNVEAMARLGLLYLRGGEWKGREILPREFVDQVRQPGAETAGLPVREGDPHAPDAPAHYGLLWWNNAGGAILGAPRDAYWAWGVYDSLIIVIPSLDIVATRAGKAWRRQGEAHHFAVLEPFLRPISEAVGSNTGAGARGDQVR